MRYGRKEGEKGRLLKIFPGGITGSGSNERGQNYHIFSTVTTIKVSFLINRFGLRERKDVREEKTSLYTESPRKNTTQGS